MKAAKSLTLMGAQTLGVYSVFRRSNWRAQRLLILGYHGISLQDEHLWRPGLFMAPDLFASRMQAISRMGCNVLSLDEAFHRLYTGSLLPLSVVLTFDDGFYDFFRLAYPVLRQFGFPATVYQTTYYSSWNKPLFNLICPYLFWKASGRIVDARPIVGRSGTFDLRTEQGRNSASLEILSFARSADLSADEKQQLVRTLANCLGEDYRELSDRRLFNLMNKAELTQLVNEGVDIQLHTHRHRVPLNKDLFFKELADNQEFLKEIGQPEAKHFTYPSGVYRKEVFTWLAEFGVRSATTCETGLANSQSNPMCLPRFIDTSQASGLEFEAWLCGLRELLWSRRNAQPKTFKRVTRTQADCPLVGD
jgi:peptidoglycan/xylan/chitin deacetylase (PgdA/CDA1 family)